MTTAELAALHASAMVHSTAWSEASFKNILSDSRVILLTDPSSCGKYLRGSARGQTAPSPTATPKAAQPVGFALGRLVAREAELLALAVAPAAQGKGVGRGLLERFEAECRTMEAESAFLEVSAANIPALKLYRQQGWTDVGRRPNYYTGQASKAADALILRKRLAVAN